MLKLRNQKANYEISVPTSKKELKFDDLNKLVENVNLSEHFAIVAISQALRPFDMAVVAKNPEKDVISSVSVHFIRANDPNGKIKANLGDKVITTRSDLERSIHLSVPSGISMERIADCIKSDESTRTWLSKGAVDENGEYVKEMITVSFKIIPLTSIYATIDNSKIIDDPFRTTISGS